MPTTTNFGWTTPADTDYVKDGANAIRTLGNGIDTSLIDLKGGTTGQILSKASNTDLDYTWINNDQGDITAVNAGTGISVTGGTGPTPTVAIDSTVATLTGTQTLTNKTINGSSNTISNISLTTGVTGTLPVGNGGTNLTTYTTGDLPYASATNTLSKLGIGSTGNVLTVSGGVPVWAAPAGGGKVLQVVQATYSTSTSTTSTSWADTGLSASITPSATSSKILVIVSQFMKGSRSANTTGGGVRLLRGSTNIFGSGSAANPYENFYYQAIGATSMAIRLQFSMTYLDSPSTTSSTTYKTQFAVENGGQSETMTAQEASSTSSIILMEIGA